jgi:aldehyde:ferredoxin oxidoreductase
MGHTVSKYKLLTIDMDKQSSFYEEVDLGVIKKYLGGEALALYLYKVASENHPTSNALIFTTSILNYSNTLSVAGKSQDFPSIESDSNVSDVATNLKSHNILGITILNSSNNYTTIKIGSEKVEFLNPRLSNHKEQESYLTIGVAGENLSPFATILENSRPLERKGFGSLMGSKKIKSLIVTKVEQQQEKSEELIKAEKKFEKRIKKSRFLNRYKEEGDLRLLNNGIKRGFVAIDNSTKRVDPRLSHLTLGELKRKLTFTKTEDEIWPSVRLRVLVEPFGEIEDMVQYFEMISLGPNLNNYDIYEVIKLYNKIIELGLNPITTGSYLATKLTSNWYDEKSTFKLVEQIATGKVKVNERMMVSLDPRGAYGSSLLMGLGEDLPLVAETHFNFLKNGNNKKIAQWVFLQENLVALSKALGFYVPYFVPFLVESLRIYPLKMLNRVNVLPLMKLLRTLVNETLDIELSEKEFSDVSRRYIEIKRKLNNQLEFLCQIEQRFIIDPKSNFSKKDVVPYRKMVYEYQFLRRIDLSYLNKEL